MHAYNHLLWAVFGWTTAGRVIMYVWQCKVKTNVYLFTTIPPVNSRQHKFGNVIAELLQKQGG